jgi:hypothetical protein
MDLYLILKEDRPDKYPPMTPGVPRYHPSWIEEYLGCGYRFFLNHKDPKHKKTRVAIAVGVGGHKTMEEANYKTLAHEVMKAREGADIAVATYDEEVKTKECTDTKQDIDAGRDTAAGCGASVIDRVLPSVGTPVLVEAVRTQIFSTDAGRIELAGTLDYATSGHGGIVIHDLKTGRKKKTADYAHGRGQLAAYGILLQGGGNEFPTGYVIDDLRLTRRGWEYSRLTTDRTEDDYAAYWARVLAVHAAIKAGSFPPAPEGSWLCSANWCEHWATCPFVASRRRHASSEEDASEP